MTRSRRRQPDRGRFVPQAPRTMRCSIAEPPGYVPDEGQEPGVSRSIHEEMVLQITARSRSWGTCEQVPTTEGQPKWLASQSSVRKGPAGNPALLTRLQSGLSPQAYRTGTGLTITSL